MKIKAIFLFVCSIVSVGAVSADKKAPESQGIYYELKLKSESFGNMGTRKMWIKGSNMRWESKSDRLPIRLIKNSSGVFMIHPWRKFAAKYPAGTPKGNPRLYLPGPTGPVKLFLKQVNAKKLGTDKVSGQRCDVYSYSDPVTKSSAKLWVGAATSKPVKILMMGERGKKDTVTATYTKFDLSAKVPDALFQIPKGYTMRPMPKPGLTSKTKKPIAKAEPASVRL
ncbi:MAG: hypothetical protein NT018_06725 [Armatimonadetes bacterium]|nr:hypothetical protein [Armatimonadota bacterium]